MKKIFIATALVMAFGGAQADTNISSTSNSNNGNTAAGAGQQQTSANTNTTSSQANAGANNQGVNASGNQVTFTSPGVTDATVHQTVTGNTTQTQIVQGGTDSTIRQEFGTQKIKNTPSVSGPPLTASNDTCMGSGSGSVNGPGFGISIGKTYTDDNCVMLKNSRELWNMGMKAAAMALMCQDKNNREALEVTGFECPTRKNRD